MPDADPYTLPSPLARPSATCRPSKRRSTRNCRTIGREPKRLNLKRLSCAKPGESNAYMEKTKFGDLSPDCHRKVNKRLNIRFLRRLHADAPGLAFTDDHHQMP